MTYTEQTLTCRDCGNSFAWTVGEQEFYASRGLTNAPGRCPECRAARKSGGGGSYSSGGSYGGGGGYSDRGPREMHEARCDSCGGVARVPFVPRGDKPVYCSDCFSRSRGSRY
jgi:CxxC-x17-CxxC domain-containing protein